MALASFPPLDPPLPAPAARLHWRGLPGAARALAISRAARSWSAPLLVVAGDSHEAQALWAEIQFFLRGSDVEAAMMPDWETLPYDVFSPHQDIISERLATLYRLPRWNRGVLVVPAETLMQRLPPRGHLERQALVVSAGDPMDLESMASSLAAAGYRRVTEVLEHGEFAVRGSLLDLFPMGSEQPLRVDLLDDEVDSIRVFDPETQRSAGRLKHVELLPAREFPTDEAAIARFRQGHRATFEGNPSDSLVYREVTEGRLPNGIEYYLPLFFEATATLFDYLPGDYLALRTEDADAALDRAWDTIAERYEQRRHDRERPLLPPGRLYLPPDQVRASLNQQAQVICAPADAAQGPLADAQPLPPLAPGAHDARPLDALTEFLAGQPGRALLVAETAGRRETLRERLAESGVTPTDVAGWQEFLAGDAGIALTVGAPEQGFQLQSPPLALIPEAAFHARPAAAARRRKGAARDPEAIIRDLSDLAIGAPVVHEDHGVGRYQGLQTLDAGGVPTEFLTLEYAGGDRLYVPVASLHRVSRYAGPDVDHAPLHRLGGEQWERARRRAARQARDVAAELLQIYARREAAQGHALRFSQEDYQRFAAAFPFEETPDQRSAIDAVLSDLASDKPMDRVVCGDVGFGKTEVAMRGAFAGVDAGRQVAVLVPTTLLAQQHYQNFKDRFADWPVRIELLSRFRTKKEQDAVMKQLAEGQVDIVIGTHKLLQSGVRFDNLGLLIIDEEHRFGVRQKERLKALRANVDVLTLTATPIPRTLNMSLSGLRDLSIIATPPARRLAVKTFVNQWNDGLIREACLRELHRGGQVYFLHNQVESIERIARALEELVPEARLRVAHGQMRERDLERVMLDFYHQRFSILVCSTIIESGIDVPSANTIIINRADRLGLAQLHQLRGRVGRSHHRAYAYLIAPEKALLTADAEKRLEAIAALEDLGVGFALASHDLEIRGAGELLGEDQSGQIQEVGFSLYSELLERAVRDLKAGRVPDPEATLDSGTDVDLSVPALLPADYLPDIHARLVLYKRIASAASPEALRELQVEMIDRFGLLPDAAKNLFRLAALRLRAEHLGVSKLEAGPGGGVVAFGEAARVEPERLVGLIQSRPEVYRLEGQHRLRFREPLPEAEQRLQAADRLLERLGAPAAA